MTVMPPIWRTRASTPEQSLAAAILAQAFTDMFHLGTREDVDTEAVQAMRYLTDRYGQVAHWRNKWCSYLDLDGDLLATRVRMILDGKVDPPRGVHLAQRLERARARWASLAHKPIPQPKPAIEPKPTAMGTPTPPPRQRLPIIKPAPQRIEPEDVDVTVVDDPLFVSCSGHLRASRQWNDGETSRILGPLPSLRTPIGQALWTVTQASRAGLNSLTFLAKDPHAFVETLRAALPNVEIDWTAKGERLPQYQPNAGLRLYLKESRKAA